MKTLERLTERCSTRQALITCERCQLSPEGRREGCFGNAESCRDVLAARFAAIEDVLGAHYNLYEIQAMLRQGRSMQQKRKEKGGLSMERYFCRDKKDYCDKDLACRDCEFAKGSGVINGVYVEDVLSTLFGESYDLDRLKQLIEADREGRCVVLPVKPDSYAYACCKDFPDPIKYYYPMASTILVDIERGYFISYDKNQAESTLKAMKERGNDV